MRRHRIIPLVGTTVLVSCFALVAEAATGSYFGGSVTIAAQGNASPYPSTLTVSGACAVTTDVDVVFQSFSHTNPDDVDILLVGPGGQNATVMSDAGGSNAVANGEFSLNDEAPGALPDTTAIADGAYQPANHDVGADSFLPPAPTPAGGSALSVFDGTNPNGTWSLFVTDDQANESGSTGWGLLITADPTSEICVPGGEATSGPATPYPDTTTVSGLSGPITDMNLRLTGVTHSFPDHLDILLVGPGGQNAIVMSDAGSDFDLAGETLTLDDEAAAPAPDEDPIAAGSYQPTNHPGNTDSWSPPAPTPSGGTALSVFDGTNPNGTWSLFVFDDDEFNVGRIDDWSLQITHAGFNPAITVSGAKVKEGKPVTFQVDLSSAPIQPFSVPFATVNGSARAGKDYKASSGNLTFAPGDTSESVKVKTRNDPKDEKNKEKFTVQVSTGNNVFVGKAAIKDDDKRT